MAKMESSVAAGKVRRFKIWNDREILSGGAAEILGTLHARLKSAPESHPEIAKMSLGDYIAAVIKDAKFLMPQDLLRSLKDEYAPGSADLALACLASASTSRMRILSAGFPAEGAASLFVRKPARVGKRAAVGGGR